MPTGSGLQQRVTAILTRLQTIRYPVVLRLTTRTGGDPDLGLGGTTVVEDTVVNPPPSVEMVPTDLVVTSGGLYQPGDYKFTFSGSVPEDLLRKAAIVYGEETMRITQMEPMVFGGTVVAWEVFARTVAPGE